MQTTGRQDMSFGVLSTAAFCRPANLLFQAGSGIDGLSQPHLAYYYWKCLDRSYAGAGQTRPRRSISLTLHGGYLRLGYLPR